MRQQQQRSRNRNRNRKSTNPLSRNFESNGPDVKIRGNASHIADKYSALARDALTSGDTVMAENYFQHAEHYFRVIAANQQNGAQTNAQNNALADGGREDTNMPSGVSAKGDENAELNTDRGRGPQPELNETPAEVILKTDAAAAANVPTEESGDDNAEEARKRQRRNGRRSSPTRRTARSNDAARAKKTDKAEPAKGEISKDASLLPGNLIGSPEDAKSSAQPGEE